MKFICTILIPFGSPIFKDIPVYSTVGLRSEGGIEFFLCLNEWMDRPIDGQTDRF